MTLDIAGASTTTTERALIASVSAIVLEAEAKKHQPTGPKKPELDEITRLRKEFADLKNKHNQLQEKMDRQERAQQYRPQRRPYRQGPQGQPPHSRGAPRGQQTTGEVMRTTTGRRTSEEGPGARTRSTMMGRTSARRDTE